MENCACKLFHIFVAILLSEIFVANIAAVKFGLITPIEVVEEWGCHDTEFRLTCSRLDSTIAILEATFSPNCTDDLYNNGGENSEDFDNCAHVDLKRLTRAYVTPRIDHRMSETEAGRRFLEKLRENHDDDELRTNGAEKRPPHREGSPRRTGSRGGGTGVVSSLRVPLLELKRKQSALRASLEELIVEYLRGLTAEGEPDLSNEYFDHNRKKRDNRRRRTYTSNTDTFANEIDGNADSVSNNIEIDVLSENDAERRRVQYNAGNLTEIDENSEYSSDEARPSTMKYSGESVVQQKDRPVCGEQKRRVIHLDRHILDSAVGNESDYEHNIRRLLNYRCSGKNHCSFVFADDHPFSVLWDSGTIRIKYVCMEAYRLNKYCGQHLIIANELQESDPSPAFPTHRTRSTLHRFETDGDDAAAEEKGEPVAEALIQNDQQFHHLKILKSSDEHAEHVEPIKPIKQKNFAKNRRVYSQDFRVLKILPSNLDDFNDIEKIGDEFYFKKDTEFRTTEMDNGVPSEYAPTQDMSKLSKVHRVDQKPTKQMADVKSTVATNDVEANRKDIDGNQEKSEIEDNILREIRSTVDYSSFRAKISPLASSAAPISSTLAQQGKSTGNNRVAATSPAPTIDAIASVSKVWENEILRQNPNIFDAMEIADENDIVIPNKTVSLIAFGNKSNEIPIDDHLNRNNKHNLLENISGNSVKIPMELDKIVISKNDGLVVKVEDTASTVVDTTVQSVINYNNDINKDNRNTNRNNAGHDEHSQENSNIDDDDDYYSSYEDYAVEVHGNMVRRKNKMRIHTSYQKTAVNKPLLQQGFIASPGYPKFYIGESNCSWRITVPHGQRIRLTILDINLRNDQICKDFIEIIDPMVGRLLFSSCNEYSRPLKIISDTNEIQVTVKTTSKLAYPKRGILLHYSALGCLIPAPPLNGRLVYNTEHIAKYICDPAYAFPDTGVHSRQLSCTARNTWDKSLPDCVERSFVSIIEPTSKLVSVLNRKKQDPRMATDTVYDIVIPSLIIAGLFIGNAFVFLIIMRYRNKRTNDELPQELADL